MSQPDEQPFDEQTAGHLIASLVITSDLPFLFVNNPELRALLCYLHQSYAPPSQCKVTSLILPQKEHAIRAAMLVDMATISSYSLSIDSCEHLKWWHNHEVRFPHISALTCCYLSIIPTSVPCEHAFSKGSWLVNKCRCSLSTQSVTWLMLLACNAQYLLKKYRFFIVFCGQIELRMPAFFAFSPNYNSLVWSGWTDTQPYMHHMV